MDQFLTKCRKDLEEILQKTQQDLLPLPLQALNHKPTPNTWSALQCIEHLNRYADWYLPEIRKALQNSPNSPAPIRYTWMGKKSLDLVRSTSAKKTLKHMDPARSHLAGQELQRFIQHQKDLIALTQKAKGLNLNRKKVRIEFMKFIRLRTGEALEFVIEHQKRHLAQAIARSQTQA